MNARLALSGLVPEDLGAYPIEKQAMATTPAFVIPYNDQRMYRIRLDRATDKYTQPKGLRDVWWSPHQDVSLFRTKNKLYIIEGELKAAKFVKTWPGLPTFGIGGCNNALIKTETGGRRLLDPIMAAIRPGMTVVAIFDGDIKSKPGVQQAAHALSICVINAGCTFEVYCPPMGKGVDDWLVQDPNAEISDLTHIPLDGLEESRKQLYDALQLSMNEEATGPILNELNCSKLLAHRFSAVSYLDKRLGLVSGGEVKSMDQMQYEALEYIQGELLPRMPQSKINSALSTALLTTKRDLVQEMFRKLEWDGVPRLNTWGSEYLQTDMPAYTREWARLLITGLTLRVLQPGTKVDFACILVGAQGIGKSTFFEELAMFGGYSFYTACTELSGDAGDANRTQGSSFAKAVIVDLAEGVVFETKKATMDRVKQRITQTFDEYREVYATSTKIEPRGFVFVGTTNRRDQLGDHTGSRRFVPIHVDKITRLPYATKLQIIAEVVAQERKIRESNWYDFQISVEDLPTQFREDKEYITSVQTLVNTQFARPDALADKIKDLVEAGECAKVNEDAYITAGFVSARMGSSGDFKNTNLVARLMSALQDSTTFPYKLSPQRKRIQQLSGDQRIIDLYEEGITNKQRMVSGYIVTPK